MYSRVEKSELYLVYLGLKQRIDWPDHLVLDFVTSTGKDGDTFIVIEHREYWSDPVGPFKPVKIVITAKKKWRLCLRSLEVLEEGEISHERSDEAIISLLQSKLTKRHTLCGGCYFAPSLENNLGYFPKSLKNVGDRVHSKSCEVWLVPKANTRHRNCNNPGNKYICASCSREEKRIHKRLLLCFLRSLCTYCLNPNPNPNQMFFHKLFLVLFSRPQK